MLCGEHSILYFDLMAGLKVTLVCLKSPGHGETELRFLSPYPKLHLVPNKHDFLVQIKISLSL